MLHRFFYKTFLIFFFVAIPAFAATADAVAEPNAHRTEAYPIGEYPRFLEEAKPVLTTGRYPDGFTPPEAPSMEATVALRPNASTSRVFISRSYENYARQCAERGEPTRLVVACGRLGHPADPMASCPGHSDAYFTINTSYNMRPDLLGDVFHMPDQAFKPGSWDFITFENFSCFFDAYSEQFLRTLAGSLRPGGVWVLNFDLIFFPSVIRIADRAFKGGRTLAEYSGAPSAMRMICAEAGKMADEETAVFESFDDVRTIVNSFFTRRGFRSAEIRNTFLLKADKNPEDFALAAGLSGEDSSGGGLFGADIDSLIGGELLPILNGNLQELALVVRG